VCDYEGEGIPSKSLKDAVPRGALGFAAGRNVASDPSADRLPPKAMQMPTEVVMPCGTGCRR